MSSLKKKAIFGMSWTMLEYGFLFTFQLAQLVVLARILTPEDFGIFAIGTFFSTLGNGVFALGMGTALIQRSGDVSEYLDTAWGANLLISFIAFVLLLIAIPFVVTFYFNDTNAIVPSLILCSIVLISGFNNIGIVLYMKKIQLKKVFFYNAVPKGVGILTSIVLSILLRSYWGLVIGVVTESLFRVFLSYKLSPIRPRFKIEKKKFYELYSFGGWLQLKNIVSWLVNNLDTFIVGSVTSVLMLGFYNRAITIARLPETQIKKVVNAVFFPLYSSFQNEKKKLQAAANAANDVVVLFLFPIVMASIYFGDTIVKIALGENWLEMTETFQLLIIALSVEAYFISYIPLIRAKGYSRIEFFFYLIKVLLLFIGLYPLTLHYGIKGAAFAILAANILASPYIIWNVYRLTSISFRSILLSLFTSILGALGGYFFMKMFANGPQDSLLNSGLLLIAIILIFFTIIYLVYQLFRIGPFKTVLKAYKTIKL